ncbi:hypothetical protein SERLA73DRAFT_181211 [Serpula lacrymans var. lacrymans S7.3]|uniref:Crinkler effector protein N-terminal domain-containing protein n=1 Tax=Serpula lacrymans var. lacrymans (strain S7.3) TaxID=936435 RepID=F8PXP1_SERL3|nr:hypothetical protein SERLA73DRAFT_181211 [Serpula lacrymans var. lacrymans S7.3]
MLKRSLLSTSQVQRLSQISKMSSRTRTPYSSAIWMRAVSISTPFAFLTMNNWKAHLVGGIIQRKGSSNGRYKLSAISPDSKEGVWFIIVRAPSSYLTITCWIYGSDVESIFNVKISSSETVSNLRDVIKNVNTNKLRNVDASDLDLYSICLPDDEQLEGTLSLWDDSEEKKLTRPLKGLDKISKVFSEPPKEDHLHIIVQNPATAGPNLSPIYQ